MTQPTVSINFRLPRELHADLVQAAGDGGRSLNSEMVRLLRSALESPGGHSLEARLAACEAWIAAQSE